MPNFTSRYTFFCNLKIKATTKLTFFKKIVYSYIFEFEFSLARRILKHSSLKIRKFKVIENCYVVFYIVLSTIESFRIFLSTIRKYKENIQNGEKNTIK